MKNSTLLCVILFFMAAGAAYGQQVDTTAAPPPPADEGEIIEAGEAVIQVTVEKPQVQLFSQRIKPEFDEVNLEKSFLREILERGRSSQININPDEKGRVRIDTDKLLNRQR